MERAGRALSVGAVLALASGLAAGALWAPPAAGQSTASDDPAGQPPLQGATLPLEGTSWRLRDYVRRGVERSSGPEVAAWMTLRGGRLEGSGGCTRLRGRYGVMGDALSVTLGRVRRGSCGEQTTMVQMGMADGLRRASTFEVQPSEEPFGEILTVRDAAGQVLLRFEPDDVAALEPGEWLLEAWTADGQRTAADESQPAVLALRPARTSAARRESSGEAVGSTGCNGLVGRYFRHADVMSFGVLERTDAPCSAALEVQEAAMIGVLESTFLALDLPPDRLVLTSAESGDSLEFVASVPLERSTWQLARLKGASVPDHPVTLFLEAGTASGIGPCGTYTGGYRTDGLFIRFSDLRGAAADACADQASEDALLRALEQSVLLDRSQPVLRMLDAKGRVVAAFRQPGIA